MAVTPASVDADLTALLRARNCVLMLRSDDEARVKRRLFPVAAAARLEVVTWDVARGFRDLTGNVIAAVQDPSQALAYIQATKSRRLYVLLDMHRWFDSQCLRTLRNLSDDLQVVDPDETRAIVLLSPMAAKTPDEIPEMTLIDYPLPDREERAKIVDDSIAALPEKYRAGAAPNGTRDRVIEALAGLSEWQARNAVNKSLVTSRTIDPVTVAGEKKRIISGMPGVTWHDPDPRGLDAVGGLALLKSWCLARRPAFTAAAKKFGLPTPKGMLLVGPPGGGKSLVSKCVATAFAVPLLRLDLGALKSKFVGDSEGNIRRVLQLAETVAPCVVMIDEIEKAVAGGSGEQGDGGVSTDQLGTLLSWMQDCTAPVFIVATANDVSKLPPELLRKGRFDELFFVDLPQRSERGEIIASAMKQHKRTEVIDAAAVARATDGFVGAEIAAIVPDALFAAFADGMRPITTADLVVAAGNVVPLSKTASEKIGALREWAKGRCRPASAPETVASNARALDLDE